VSMKTDETIFFVSNKLHYFNP